MTTPRGKVYLVGAGPGDPELLTVKAARLIASADLVLCDALVPEALLVHAAPRGRVVRVGKRGGRPSTSQAFIERLMIRAARRGLAVVRLKGGDPLVFGRAAEECRALRDAGIDLEIVNGITAGLAAAASLGISLTHRALCHGAILVTGRLADGAAIDWPSLVRTGLPLVIYMGASGCEEIGAALVAAGMAADTPAAALCNATRGDERAVTATVATLALSVRSHAIESPAILIVGEVAREARVASRTMTRGPGIRAHVPFEQRRGTHL